MSSRRTAQISSNNSRQIHMVIQGLKYQDTDNRVFTWKSVCTFTNAESYGSFKNANWSCTHKWALMVILISPSAPTLLIWPWMDYRSEGGGWNFNNEVNTICQHLLAYYKCGKSLLDRNHVKGALLPCWAYEIAEWVLEGEIGPSCSAEDSKQAGASWVCHAV